jgi:hypothetical protein
MKAKDYPSPIIGAAPDAMTMDELRSAVSSVLGAGDDFLLPAPGNNSNDAEVETNSSWYCYNWESSSYVGAAHIWWGHTSTDGLATIG